MSPRNLANFVVAVLGAVTFAACSGQSPLSPGISPGAAERPTMVAAKAVPGIYELSFFKSGQYGLEPVLDSTLTVFQELTLKGHVADSSGVPARSGSVTFEYCSLKGAPAPSTHCDSGSGSWTHLIVVRVNGSGDTPYVSFGYCSSESTIGFRFRYAGQGSGIANGLSPSRDVSWVSAG
jgi:hypothetical protein